MISAEKYTELKKRNDAYTAWLATLGRNHYVPDEVPADARITNEERSAIEVYEFIANPPTRYTAYIKWSPERYMNGHTFTTWMGDTLGSLNITRKSTDGRGNRVWYVSGRGINGKTYYGRHYPDAGDYAHLTMHKNQK